MMRTRVSGALVVSVAALALVATSQASAAGEAQAPAAGVRQTVSGTGASVPSLRPIREPVIVTLTHTGASNFIVNPVSADGDEGYLWANEIGDWTGTIFQAKESVAIVAASVEADGPWTIRIAPLAAAPVVNPRSYAGSGSAVVKFRVASQGFKRITLTHDGEANFIVHPIDRNGSEGYLLVNEIGRYEGTKVLPKGTRYLSVVADGDWTIKVS